MRGWLTRALISAGLALVVAVPATESLAQKTPAPTTRNAVELGFNLCLQALGNIETMSDSLAALGWTIEEDRFVGPYAYELRANQSDDRRGNSFFYASVEIYATVEIGYCSLAVEGTPEIVDLREVTRLYDMEGETQISDEGAYGTWEAVLDMATIFVLAHQEDDKFFFQLTTVSQRSGNR